LSTFAITIDGVLRKQLDQTINQDGLFLYEALSYVGRVALLGSDRPDVDDRFCRINGLNRHFEIIPEAIESASTAAGRRIQQVRSMRQEGLQFVVEPDPEIALEMFRNGMTVLPYLHPRYTQPSFRPDYSSRAQPWETLISEVDYQIDMKAKQIELPTEEDE